MRIGSVFLNLLIVSALVAANREDDAPRTRSVEIFHCDFGEASDTNFDLWPDNWTRLRGPGYPQYVKIGIVDQGPPKTDAAGKSIPGQALKIKLDGGGALVSTPPAPVAPRFSYVLEAQVRAISLRHDVASVTLKFLDERRQVLEEIESEQVSGTSNWTSIRIGPVAPQSENTRFAVITFHVRPRDREDLRGEALLGELRLSRLPRMTLRAGGIRHLYFKEEPIEVTTDLTGMSANDNQVQFELFDPYGKQLAQQKQLLLAQALPAIPGDAKVSLAATASWKPPVPGPGFYHVVVSMVGEDGLQLQRSISLAVIESKMSPGSGEFGWTLPDGEHPLDFGPLTTLLTQAGINWVKFPAWYSDDNQARADRLAWFAERLSQHGIEMVGLLDQPPPNLAKQFGATERLPVALLFIDRDVWQPALDPVMMRLSLKVHWWQLGGDDDASYVGMKDLPAKIGEIKQVLDRYGQETRLGLAWQPNKPVPQGESLPWAMLSYVDAIAKPSTEPDGVQELTTLSAEQIQQQFPRDGKTARCWFSLRPLPKTGNDTTTRVADLLRRMIAARSSGIHTTFVSRPFDDEIGLLNSDGTPGELFLPWRTTALATAGRESLGTLRLPRGSTNHVFASESDAVMVVWNERTVREHAFLGDNVQRVDLWGRQSPLPMESIDGIRQQVFEVGPEPIILTGLNARILRWCMAFEFERTTLESVFGQAQPVAYKFRNSFDKPVGGEVTLTSPGLWDGAATPQRFRLAAGEERKESFPLLLKNDADSGPQKVRVDFTLTAEDEYRFSLYRTLTVGLDEIAVELDTLLDESGEMVVKAHVSNRTGKPVHFRATLFAPDRRRQQIQLAVPGPERTTATYHLSNGKELLGKDLRLRLEELGGSRVLNNHVKAQE